MSGDNSVAIGLDVGGTAVKAGLVDRQGELLSEPQTFPMHSDQDAETVLAEFEQVLRTLWNQAGSRPVVGIGVGMPGPFDYAEGISRIQGLAKYDSIYGVNLKEDWRRRLDLPASFPIRFVNDAAAFGLGESIYGAGRGRHRVMALTLGTGCGCSFVIDGQIQTDGPGVPKGGEIYWLPFHGGMIDDWISRRGILRLWQEIAPDAPSNTDVKELADAAYGGDQWAKQLFTRFGELWAEALVPVAEGFRPDCLIVGGRIAGSLPLFDQPLRGGLAALGCELIRSTLAAPGVRGGASLVLQG